MIKESPAWDKLVELRTLARDLKMEDWLSNDLFSINWWFLLVFILVFLFIGWRLVDRTRLMEILLVGCMAAIIGDFLDVAGSSFVLWSYPIMFIPVMPPMVPVNLVYLPVMYMLMYQYFTGWKSYIAASIVLAAFNSFVCEPITVWLKLYKLNNWEYIYSFPIYIAMAVFIKWVMLKIKISESRNREKGA